MLGLGPLGGFGSVFGSLGLLGFRARLVLDQLLLFSDLVRFEGQTEFLWIRQIDFDASYQNEPLATGEVGGGGPDRLEPLEAAERLEMCLPLNRVLSNSEMILTSLFFFSDRVPRSGFAENKGFLPERNSWAFGFKLSFSMAIDIFSSCFLTLR